MTLLARIFYLQNHVDFNCDSLFLQRLEKCVTAKENLEADLFSKVFVYVDYIHSNILYTQLPFPGAMKCAELCPLVCTVCVCVCVRVSDFPRSRKSRGIADLKRNP